MANKYIDAEKLKKAIEDKGLDCSFALKMERLDTLALIDELQQEQPEATCKTCGFYENNCPFIRGKLIPYPNKVCKDYTYSAMKEKEQEQLEAELEKEMDKFYGMYRDGNGKTYDAVDNEPCFDWKEDETATHELRLARHFAEWGATHLNARKEN